MVAILLVACVVVGWFPNPAGAATAEGSITGRVTDSVGRPIGPGSGICALVGRSTSNWSNLGTDGTYRIDGVPAGSYGVRFEHCAQPTAPWPHFSPEYFPNRHHPSTATSPAPANVVVPAGGTVTGVDATLEPASTLRVTVEDSAGAGRQGVCVGAAWRGDLTFGAAVGQLPTEFNAVTDASGVATLQGMTPGNFVLRASVCARSPFTHPDLTRWQYSGGVFDPVSASTTPVALSATVDTRLVMQPGASIVGTATGGGEPLADTCVVWSTHDSLAFDQGEFSTMTAADGSYQLRGLPPTVPGVVRACAPLGSTSTAPLWLPAAASRWTAEILRLAPGSVRTWNAALQARPTVSAIVTSLPSATNCRLRLDSPNGARFADLRPASTIGAWYADAFGIHPDSVLALECSGRIVGRSRAADQTTPGFKPGWTENLTSPVGHIIADLVGPTITASGAPSSWIRTAARVTFACTDEPAGVSACPAPATFSEGQVRTVTARDNYGNVTSRTLGPLKIDQTPPAITVASTRRSFRTNELISLGCAVRDPRSGLRTRTITCPPDRTRASTLGPGEHTFTLRGIDNAGNSAAATVTITVVK